MPFEQLSVNWSQTKAWSESGQVFFNVQGREPQGVVPASEYESFQDEMKARLEALPGPDGKPLDSRVFKPQEIYRDVRNPAPDVIVYFGGLHWRSIDSVGYGRIHVQGNERCWDSCNSAPYGIFVLTAPNCPLSGEYKGAHLLDIAPTLLDLAGYEIPETMQGRSLVAGMERESSGGGSKAESERIVHDRLAGLGYV
jgi:predicted AlkP superfamily phosphohydrolase/phosphomutase